MKSKALKSIFGASTKNSLYYGNKTHRADRNIQYEYTLLKFTSYITKRGNVKRGLFVNDSFKKFNLLHSRGVLEMQTKIIFISTSN
jgi:hypothetical protein